MAWSVGAGLEGRGVILTGATGGIGAAVAARLRGGRGEGHGRRPRPGPAGRARRRAGGHRATSASWPTCATSSTHDAARRARDRRSSAASTSWPTWPPCCAAAARSTRSPRTTGTSSTTSTSSRRSSSRARPGNAMIAAGEGGRIILFSSQGWWTGGFGGSVAYASTKGGVTTMCRGLARTFGPHQITVNCVSPGPGQHADADDRPRARGLRDDEEADARSGTWPSPRSWPGRSSSSPPTTPSTSPARR